MERFRFYNQNIHAAFCCDIISCAFDHTKCVLVWHDSLFKSKSPHQATVTIVASKNGDVLNYIATYLIPFVSFKTDKINDLLAFVLLMIIMAIVYINANIYFINPFLILMRYSIVEINDTYITICKGTFSRRSYQFIFGRS